MTSHIDHSHEEDVEETRPLLSPSSQSHHGSVKSATPQHCSPHRWSWKYVVLACIVLAVISNIGECLYLTPRVRLFESVVCTQYYRFAKPSLIDSHGSVPEQFCKIKAFQEKVASVLGWQVFFDSIPAILLPIPYGCLADTYGRKWILFLALTGYTLSWAFTLLSVGPLKLPLSYVWLSSLFFLIGGGPTTGTTLITTIVADVVPPELRSTVFFYRFCTDLVAEFFITPITSILMAKNVWIPLLVGVAFQGLGVLLTIPRKLGNWIPWCNLR